MTEVEEFQKNVDMLFIAVVSQGVKDLIEKDPAIRKSAQRFFFDQEESKRVVFPSERATRFYERMKRALEKAKREGDLKQKTRKFKKYTVKEVKQKNEERTDY